MLIGLVILSSLSAAPTLSKADAQVLSGIVATAAAGDARFEVLTADDVRTATDFEATRQLMGCAESSCLVEIANALDARFVVSGTLGTLGDQLVLQLSTLDVKDARAVGRQSLRGADTSAIATQAEAAIKATLANAAGSGGDKLRVLVMDFGLAAAGSDGPVTATPPEAPTDGAAGTSAFVVGGAGTLVLGAVLAGGGVVCDVLSTQTHAETTANRELSGAAANARYDVSDGLALAAGIGYVAGAVAVVGGGVVLGLGLMGE